jgi:hypothetical protein
MFATNRYLTVADIAFSALDIIERHDYVAVGDRIINATATVAAVIVGIITYVITALQLFWLEHSESIIINAVRFIVTLADFAGGCYYAGRKLRPYANLAVNRVVDSAFHVMTR